MVRILGVMTGTSGDGCDGTIADFHISNGTLIAHILESRTSAFPPDLRSLIAAAGQPEAANGNQYALLHYRMGVEIADFCSTFSPASFDAVAMHGQTVNHFMRAGQPLASLQLGDSARVAAATGVPVIHDIRCADIAADGQGAPLVTILDWMLYLGFHHRHMRRVSHSDSHGSSLRGSSSHGTSLRSARDVSHGSNSPDINLPALPAIAFANIGGIANVTLCRASGALAADTGPGNCLIDAYLSHVTEGRIRFDAGGRIAASGTVDHELLALMLSEPFFSQHMPKSTGRERFNLTWLTPYLKQRGLNLSAPLNPDIVATLTALTARTLGASLRAAHIDECFFSGGGVKNRFLMEQLERFVHVHTTDELGVKSDTKEALMMALIGYATLSGQPGVVAAPNGQASTGARYASILGSVTPPPRAVQWPHTTGAHTTGVAQWLQAMECADGVTPTWPLPLIVMDRHETGEAHER